MKATSGLRVEQIKNLLAAGGPIERVRLLRAGRQSLLVSYVCALRDLAEPVPSSRNEVSFAHLPASGNLDRFIALGRRLRVLRGKGPTYRLGSGLARSVMANPGHLADFVDEVTTYHARVIEQLRTGDLEKKAAYLDSYGALIARSSLVAFPFLAPVVGRHVAAAGGDRWLDLGAGSGAYTEVVADAVGEAATVTAIDTNSGALEVLTARLAGRPGESVQVRRASMLPALREMDDRSVDGVTLLNNLYYFDSDELAELFGELRRVLTGRLVVACLFGPGTDTFSVDLDLALAATQDCHPLPERSLVVTQLADAGFTVGEQTRVIPRTELWCLTCI